MKSGSKTTTGTFILKYFCIYIYFDSLTQFCFCEEEILSNKGLSFRFFTEFAFKSKSVLSTHVQTCTSQELYVSINSCFRLVFLLFLCILKDDQSLYVVQTWVVTSTQSLIPFTHSLSLGEHMNYLGRRKKMHSRHAWINSEYSRM